MFGKYHMPIVVRIGDFPNLILGEENNTWR